MNFGTFFGVLAAALIMAFWVTILAKRDPDPAGTLLALLRKAAEREGKAETLKSGKRKC